MAANKHTVVLDHERINLTIERLAHEVYEKHHSQKSLLLIGIKGRGYDIAQRIHMHLSDISAQELSIESMSLDKTSPKREDIQLSLAVSELKGATVILIDDVLNSGKTLVHALSALLDHQPKSISTVVLVDRIHRDFPVRADMVGMTLSTTLEERVEVSLGKQDYAYLV